MVRVFVATSWSRPGDGGNVVVSGHVDYFGAGPAVFWDLRKFTPDDVVDIRLEDGTVYSYRVTAVTVVNPESTPRDQVIGPTNHEVLTLITCAGTFDESRMEYDQRLIVRAERSNVQS